MIKIELEINRTCGSIDGLSRGHITIYGPNSLYTSKHRSPDQSMMIFLSIPLLLDGVRQFVTNPRTRSYTFVGVDCSFQFHLTQEKNNQIAIVCERQNIGQLSREQLLQMVWGGVSAFISMHGEQIDSNDIASDDLHASMKKFEEIL